MLIDLHCPVEPRGYEITIDKKKELTSCALTLYNLTDKDVNSVEVRLKCFDSFGEPVGDSTTNEVSYYLQDLNVRGKSFFGDNKPIPLADHPTTRTVSVTISRVKFTDGEVWTKGDYALVDVSTKKLTGKVLEDLRAVAGEDAICYARQAEDYWQCVCGRANAFNAKSCLRCKREKANVTKCLISGNSVLAIIEKIRLEKVAVEKRQREELKKINDELKQKQLLATKKTVAIIKKAAIPAVALLIIAIIVVLGYQLFLKDLLAYNHAVSLMEQKAYGEAVVIFKALDDYSDSEEMLLQSNYSQAKTFFETKKYKEAAELFKALGNYHNSVEMLFLSSLAATGVEYYINNESGATPIGDLPIGARVVDLSWKWEHRTGSNYSGNGSVKPVLWIVVAKNHYAGIENHVTLLAEEVIGLYLFDNSTGRGSSNHWGDSGTGNATHGLRPWLNSNGIHANDGFYNAFSETFKQSVLITTLPNRERMEGNNYMSVDMVFIPSTTELGDSLHRDTYSIGKVYDYFKNTAANKRIAVLANETKSYWTRSPFSNPDFDYQKWYYGEYVHCALSRGDYAGQFNWTTAYNSALGVRPALNINAQTMVTAIKE